MSSVINPVGPEEPSTYWRRRAIVVVALLLVLWLGWMLVRAAFGGGGGDEAAAGPSPEPTFGLSISPEPSGSASPDASGSPEASQAPSSSPAPTATGTCADSDIAVAASTGSATTTVGAGMALTMTVTNTGTAPCSRDVGAGANELRITSGSAVVWSSDFCNPSKDTAVEVLEPGKAWSTSVTWPGTVTAEGCPAEQPPAQPGAYQVTGRNAGADSAPAAFTVQ
ncbi:MAG TPA: hypothetical protein VF143_09300 [Candidatus Nanopelagicales bacterium]